MINKSPTSPDGIKMRRSTALTFEMIKTSNRLNAMRGLGIGAGVLGAGALGALGLQYLPSADAAMAGGSGMADGVFGAMRSAKPVAAAMSDAYGLPDSVDRPSSMSDRVFGLGRAGAGAASRLGSMMDISGSPSGLVSNGRSVYDRIFDPQASDLANY